MKSTSLATCTFLIAFFSLLERGGCDVNLYSTSGYISSPNYPNSYSNNYDNTWVIHVTSGYSVTLTFLTFDLEYGSSCPFDYVEVRQGSALGTSLTGKLCGTAGLYSSVTSSTSLWVRFKTDSSSQGTGFRASYTQSVGSSAGTYCTFVWSTSRYCTYGCCYSADDCCTSSSRSSGTSSSYSSYVSTSVQAWVIAVIVVGSLIGLGVVISIIVCIVKAVKGSKVTAIQPSLAVQPSIAVVSSSAGASTSQTPYSAWAVNPQGLPGYARENYGPVPPPPTYSNPPA